MKEHQQDLPQAEPPMKDDAKAPSKRGRPVEHSMPDPIPDTPENIMKAFLKTPPRKREEWKFVQERDKKQAP